MNNPAKLVQQADEALKVSMFKWAPDHLEAAALFEKAGAAYRAAGDGANACTCYERAAKSHASQGGLGWHRQAQALENGAKAFPARAADLYQASAKLYLDNAEVEGAVDTLGRAAAAVEASDANAALAMYVRAADLVQVGDGYTRGMARSIEVLRSALARLVKARKLPEAIAVGRKLMSANELLKQGNAVHKMHLAICILLLARGDVAAAQQELSAASADMEFIRSDEYEVADELLRAWTALDSEKVRAQTHSKVVINIEREVAMLARELDPLKGRTAPAPAAAPLATSAKPARAAVQESAPPHKQAEPTRPPQPAEPGHSAMDDDDDLPDLR